MQNKNLTLLTDLYQLTMMQAYFKKDIKDKTVVFDMFYRKNPFNNSYAIFCGLDSVIEYIQNLKFTENDINYLRKLNLFEEDFLEYLQNFKFTADLYSVKEGSVVFPMEPLIKVVGNILEAQLVETAMLTLINHQSLIATKASRIKYVSDKEMFIEMGARRAQGESAAIYGSRASFIGGATGTSNILAGKMYDIPLFGTHAHSFIMSFDNEYEAFLSYANTYKENIFLLIDTYNTMKSGIINAIKVFEVLKKENRLPKSYGIRLDSGDIAYLSKKCRKLLDNAGFFDAKIIASNDLDENIINSLKMQGAKVDIWGVGTKLITASDCPSFGGVYKMAAVISDKEVIPKIKKSDNIEKITNPGDKKVFRIIEKSTNKIKADLITLSDESYDNTKDLIIFDPKAIWKETTLIAGEYDIYPLHYKIFENGKLIYDKPTTKEIREYTKKELDLLWDESRRLTNPHLVYVDLSKKLYDLKIKILKNDHIGGK